MAGRGKIAEMAEAEAQRAESEGESEDEEGEAEDGEPEPDADDENEQGEPDAHEASVALSLEARDKAVGQEIARHLTELGGLLGDAFDDMEICPTCGALGAVPITRPKDDPRLVRCENCGGYGFYLTPSLNESHATRTCLVCSGFGYVEHVEAPAPAVTYAPPTPPFGNGVAQPAAQPAPPPATPIPPMPVYDPTANVWKDPQTGAVLGGASPSVPASAPAA